MPGPKARKSKFIPHYGLKQENSNETLIWKIVKVGKSSSHLHIFSMSVGPLKYLTDLKGDKKSIQFGGGGGFSFSQLWDHYDNLSSLKTSISLPEGSNPPDKWKH